MYVLTPSPNTPDVATLSCVVRATKPSRGDTLADSGTIDALTPLHSLSLTGPPLRSPQTPPAPPPNTQDGPADYRRRKNANQVKAFLITLL
jgi:hypothetical protein